MVLDRATVMDSALGCKGKQSWVAHQADMGNGPGFRTRLQWAMAWVVHQAAMSNDPRLRTVLLLAMALGSTPGGKVQQSKGCIPGCNGHRSWVAHWAAIGKTVPGCSMGLLWALVLG